MPWTRFTSLEKAWNPTAAANLGLYQAALAKDDEAVGALEDVGNKPRTRK